MDEIKQDIFRFVSKHEANISREMDYEKNVRFTTYGNQAACRAIYEIISSLDENNRTKVVDMIKSKR